MSHEATTFLLLRHAAHDWLGRGLAGRLPTVSLNALGWQQAESLAGRLAGQPVDAVYSSPQPRALQTVAALACSLRLPVQVDPGVDEIDFGAWTGCSFESLQDDPAWQAWNDHRDQGAVPGGERWCDVQDRAWDTLHRLHVRHPGQTVLLASHADVIKAVVARVLQLPGAAIHRFEIGPASVSSLRMGAGWAQLLSLNATG